MTTCAKPKVSIRKRRYWSVGDLILSAPGPICVDQSVVGMFPRRRHETAMSRDACPHLLTKIPSQPPFQQVTQFSESHVEVDVKMKYISNVDLLLDDGRAGITLGVSHLAFEGWLIIVLRLIGKTPIIGSFCAHFADTPQIATDVAGHAQVLILWCDCLLSCMSLCPLSAVSVFTLLPHA